MEDVVVTARLPHWAIRRTHSYLIAPTEMQPDHLHRFEYQGRQTLQRGPRTVEEDFKLLHLNANPSVR